MKELVTTVLLAIALLTCFMTRAEAAQDEDLVFVGVVTKIELSRLEGSRKHWAASTEIEAVESGSFNGKSFSFRIHSPAKADLEVGGRYRFHATYKDGTYTLSEFNIERQE